MLSETARVARDLIRFDTTNFGEGRSQGEDKAAEYVADYLSALGLKPQTYFSAPGRANVVARFKGSNPDLPALVVHGHLDVVPADASEWSVDPFGGVIKDGYLWGRGAVDMKDMVAMMLSSVKQMVESGRQPKRDLILVFFADEESGGAYGARYMIKEHPEVFAGATEAISEVGGYSFYVGDKKAYLLQTAEKAILWVRITVSGTPGHGSLVHTDNPVMKLAKLLERIAAHPWPAGLTETARSLFKVNLEMTGTAADPELLAPAELIELAKRLSPLAELAVKTTVNPTMLEAGYKHNVVPGTATAAVDFRPLPGCEDQVLAELIKLAGDDARVEVVEKQVGFEMPLDVPLVEDMKASLLAFDPEAAFMPYMLSGGTDNKSMYHLGIKGYGFAPLLLPKELNFWSLFHGVDERIPLTALDFGHNVLTDFLLRTAANVSSPAAGNNEFA